MACHSRSRATDRPLAARGGTDCEHIGTGWLAQPANAASSLAYVAVGGWLLHRAAERPNDRVSLVAAGTAMAVVGRASAAYHGPQPAWGGPAHDWSIAWLVVVLIGLSVWRVTLGTGRREGVTDARRWWAACMLGRRPHRLRRGPDRIAAVPAGSLWQPHAAWHVLSALGVGGAVRLLCSLRAPE